MFSVTEGNSPEANALGNDEEGYVLAAINYAEAGASPRKKRAPRAAGNPPGAVLLGTGLGYGERPVG